MARWQTILDRVKSAVGDTTDADAQAWIMDAARELNTEARFMTTTASVGSTVVGQGSYSLSAGVVDVYSVVVSGVPYTLTTPAVIERLDAGYDRVLPPGGVYAEGYDSAGVLQVQLRPVPDASGLVISARQVVPLSDPVWASGDPPFPQDFDDVLIAGGVSQGMLLQEEREDLAAVHRAKFESGIKRLKARRSGRVGKSPVQIRILGVS